MCKSLSGSVLSIRIADERDLRKFSATIPAPASIHGG